jgi:hypothetical protein
MALSCRIFFQKLRLGKLKIYTGNRLNKDVLMYVRYCYLVVSMLLMALIRRWMWEWTNVRLR